MKTFKKHLLLCALFLGITNLTLAQDGYEKGEMDVNLGLNIGWGIGAVATFDYGIADDISIGGGLSFSGQNSFNYFTVGARGDYHFARLFSIDSDISDVYAGLTLGYRNVGGGGDFIGSGYNDLISDVFFGGHVGYRYTLNEKLGLYAEIGYPLSSLGVSFSL